MENFIKNFADWFSLKPKLDRQSHKPPMVEESNIFWCRLGENVGGEISGKGTEFTRPAIIHTKLSQYSFLIIPTTTKLYKANGSIKENGRFIKFTHGGVTMLACLSQVRIIDYRRLKNKLGNLDNKDFDDICTAFSNLYNKNKFNFQK
jgi:mRNA interferase MazF